MSDRFNFRTPIYGADGKFKKFVYWPAVYGAPAVTCREGDVFKAPEQCTGQKDEKGRLIYEGDVLKVANGSINGKIIPFLLVVKWEKPESGFNVPIWAYNEDGDFVYDFSHWFEVVGNIHENPELLEDKK